MMETITLRTSVNEWRKDLDLSMIPLGIFRKQYYKQELHEQLKNLQSVLCEYDGVHAMLIHNDPEIEPYWYKLEVRVNKEIYRFQSYVSYEINADKKLTVQMLYTKRPSTNEFPISAGLEWETLVLTESEIKDPAYVAAYMKNQFICFESFRQIGRDILYVVLEE